MTNVWKTFGHNEIKKMLERQLQSGKFAHAYLFTGPAGIGKKMLAMEFAQKILQAADLNNHPDFQVLDESGQISVERIRDFISSLSYKPFLAKKKVAIIDNCQNLNQQSSNALLKTLEEPSDSTILILISGSGKLLPTIVSRCQVFNFNALSLKQLREYAKTSGLSADEDRLSLSFGSVARLRQACEGNEIYQARQQAVFRFKQIQGSTTAERLLAISEFSDLEEEDLKDTLQTWLSWQAQELRGKPENFGPLKALSEALEQMRTNKNKKLILQGLFLKL